MTAVAASAGGGRGAGGGAAPGRRGGRLPRRCRLRRAAEFQEAFDGGVKAAGRLMALWVRRGTGAALRLGVVASRRQFRRAVDRARAKRLLREAYRLNRGRLRPEGDVVLVARQALGRASRQDAERELLALAARVGMLAAAEATRCAGS